ncbi:hypothetical protein [Marinobacter alkaliphilus]|uniref:hypothetical protein n=1 Tax=Marinobacter alkaliphilus TaxID=254719 RepID=UPI003D80C6CD|nr:hypothetical protein PBN92_19545 [Marinobacter alkaliphilus]
MRKLISVLVCSSMLSTVAMAQQSQPKQQELVIDKYYEALDFDRKTECVSDNRVYSVGMEIEKDGQVFECNKFNLHATALDKDANASWKPK